MLEIPNYFSTDLLVRFLIFLTASLVRMSFLVRLDPDSHELSEPWFVQLAVFLIAFAICEALQALWYSRSAETLREYLLRVDPVKSFREWKPRCIRDDHVKVV